MDFEPTLTVSFPIRALLFLLKALNLFEGIFTEEDLYQLKSLYEIQPLDTHSHRYAHHDITKMYGSVLKKEIRRKLKHGEPLEQFDQAQNECLKSLITHSGLIMPPKERAVKIIKESLKCESVDLRNPNDHRAKEVISLEWYILYMISYYGITIFMLHEKDNFAMVIEDDLPQKYRDFAKEKGISLISEPWKNSAGLFNPSYTEIWYRLSWAYDDELEKIF